jgi:carbonic anhydrase/acetyltransferase-like protein (isoleucine patch superfamily)
LPQRAIEEKTMILPYGGKQPRIEKNVFIAPTAVVIGDVEIQEGASVWYGAVLRGDMSPITVGRYTNIQDNCTVHTDRGCPARIGAGVTIGHNAVIHGCVIEEECLISIGAAVLSGAVVRCGSLVAAGAVVKEGQEIGPGQLAAGMPAAVKRALTESDRELIRHAARVYADLAARHARLADGPPPQDAAP